jgi:hypothetical protein
MTKKVLNLHIEDLLQQIESVDRRINMWSQGNVDGVAMSMIRQYSIMKEEFVERLNILRTQTSVVVTKIKRKPTTISKRMYSNEPLAASVANESAPIYFSGKKDNRNIISENQGIIEIKK